MLVHALVIVVIVVVSAASAAGQCFVDPSTGIRACCMDCGDTRPPTRDGGSREPRPVVVPMETPFPAALKQIQHDKEDERALLRRLVVRAESLPVGPAAMPTRTFVVPAGEVIFGNTRVLPAVELRVPMGYTPPSSIPLENLRRAATIIRAIPAQPCENPYDPCNEDTRFLGEQAGKALAGKPGEPLQVVVPELRVADVAARRKEAAALIVQAVAAGEKLDELRRLLDPIERRLAPLTREYDAGSAARGAEQETLEKQYRSLVEQERKTQEELGQLQKRVATIIVEVVP
jgi:hypothetical protein